MALSQNARFEYDKKYTIKQLGNNVGELIKKYGK